MHTGEAGKSANSENIRVLIQSRAILKKKINENLKEILKYKIIALWMQDYQKKRFEHAESTCWPVSAHGASQDSQDSASHASLPAGANRFSTCAFEPGNCASDIYLKLSGFNTSDFSPTIFNTKNRTIKYLGL